MSHIEELLKDWVLDDAKLEAQKAIFARVPESRHQRMDLIHKLDDYIEKSPRSPDKLFEALKLPVDRIKIDSVSGNGFKRVFVREGKNFARPELVAKNFYESQGYKVTWSEGVAFGMALNAILYEMATRLKGYFKVIPQRIYTDAEVEEIRNGRGVSKERRIENNEYEKKRPEMLASGGKNAARVLANVFNALQDDENYETLFDGVAAKYISPTCSLAELKVLFDNSLKEIVFDCAAEELERWLPILSELKLENPRDKWNYNEWSIAFARELLTDFPRRALHEYILKRGGFTSQCFDLTLFDVVSGEIKFVEVKIEDKLTEWQLMDLKGSICAGLDIGLAVIEMP